MESYTLGAVFARGGSKGVPQKNLRVLAGRPLVAHAVLAALQVPEIERVIVSTDDDEIAEAAREAGAEVPFMRPAELATDESPEWLSWQHAVRSLEAGEGAAPISAMISVPATAPLRSPEDVSACVRELQGTDADVVITVAPATHHPSFNMVAMDEAGYLRLAAADGSKVTRRQDTPPLWNIATVAYAIRRDFLLGASSLFDGKVRAVVVPPERALDIDTEFDMHVAAYLMESAP